MLRRDPPSAASSFPLAASSELTTATAEEPLASGDTDPSPSMGTGAGDGEPSSEAGADAASTAMGLRGREATRSIAEIQVAGSLSRVRVRKRAREHETFRVGAPTMRHRIQGRPLGSTRGLMVETTVDFWASGI